MILYLHHPALPNKSPGWWGWWDQGKYLAAAKEIANFSLTSANQIYPPLYSFLGAIFVNAIPNHPFFLINYIGFALHITSILVISNYYFGRWLSITSLFFCFWFFESITLQQWVIPWTTSLADGIAAALILLLWRCYINRLTEKNKKPISQQFLAIFFLLYGCLALTRPIDMLVFAPISCGLFYLVVEDYRMRAIDFQNIVISTLIILTSTAIGLVILMVFNQLAFSNPLGGYFSMGASNGYMPSTLPTKLISILFDSQTIFVEDRQFLASRFPILYVALPVSLITIFTGPFLLRIIACSVLCAFIIYAPYGDLLPNGLFRFMNVHYFKWALPWLFLLTVGQVLTWYRSPKRNQTLFIAGTLTLFLMLLQLRIVNRYSVVDSRTSNRVSISLEHTQEFNFIDIDNVKSTFNAAYTGQHLVQIDNKPLVLIRDFRVVPSDSGVRIVFNKPQSAQKVDVKFAEGDEIKVLGEMGKSHLSTVSSSLTCKLSKCHPNEKTIKPGKFSHPEHFSFGTPVIQDISFDQNWNDPEAWGRWTNNTKSNVLIKTGNREFNSIGVEFMPLLGGAYTQQHIKFMINECLIVEKTARLEDNSRRQIVRENVPEACIKPDGQQLVTIISNYVARPADINASPDKRNLGVGIYSIDFE